MSKIEILVGMIASGKSTYCKERAKAGSIIVNDDAIVNALHADQYRLYDKALKPLYKAVENTIITTALAMGHDVVIDRPCLSKATRRRYIGLGTSMDAFVMATVMPCDTPLVHAQRRFEKDSRGGTLEEWTQVATYHYSKFEEPTLEEGLDEIMWVKMTDGMFEPFVWAKKP